MKLISNRYEDNHLKLEFLKDDVSTNTYFRVEIQEKNTVTSIPYQCEGNRLSIQIPFRRDRGSTIKVLIFEKNNLKFQLRTQLHKYTNFDEKPSEKETDVRKRLAIKYKDESLKKDTPVQQTSDKEKTIQQDISFDLKDISTHAMQIINGESAYAVN